VADDAGGVAAEQVVADVGLVGADDDEVDADLVGVGEDLLVDAAEANVGAPILATRGASSFSTALPAICS
jgi:hypothetical protein